MFENFNTALVQAIGFLGIFCFFLYNLLFDNNQNNSYSKTMRNKSSSNLRASDSSGAFLFFKRKPAKSKDYKPKKSGWFK